MSAVIAEAIELNECKKCHGFFSVLDKEKCRKCSGRFFGGELVASLLCLLSAAIVVVGLLLIYVSETRQTEEMDRRDKEAVVVFEARMSGIEGRIGNLLAGRRDQP